MKKQFTLSDITKLAKSFGAATIANDCFKSFLNGYQFADVYSTEDESLVFEAGDEHQIQIEVFHFEHPLMREISILHWENGQPVFLNSKDLQRVA